MIILRSSETRRLLAYREKAEMDDCGSSSSSSWRHLPAAWSWSRTSRSSRDAERHLTVDVCSALGRPPASSFVSSAGLVPGPPPLLPLAATRRTVACGGDLKLERVPTPTRADRLLVAPGDEHEVTVCFPRRHGRSRVTEVEEVKLAMMSDDFRASHAIRADSAVMSCRPPYYHPHPVDTGEDVPASDTWVPVVSDSSTDEWAVPDKTTGQLSALSGARTPGEVDGNRFTQTADDNFQPTAVHRRLLPLQSRYGWTAAAQRRDVEFDAKYRERRRKNNEAAKRSRDIRRANERRVALRAALLERENARLRSEVGTLTEDTLRLHYYLLCSRTFRCSHCHHRANE